MRLTSSYITTIILSFFFIACQSESQPAAAKVPAPPTRFHEEPVKSAPPQLSYDTSTGENRNMTRELDNYYKAQVRAGFNGAVLVGSNGKIIYERYFGYSNHERRIPMNVNSSSQLASISKTFTGTAVLYLYQHNYLNIDDPVQKYLPEFPYPAITVRMLLCHRSGLPDYTRWVPLYDHDTRTPISNATMLDIMAKYKPGVEFRPNTRFKYSNTNFAVLASIIEKITDMRYPDFMAKYIFQPLGMYHSFVFDATKGLPVDATISYRRSWSREPEMFADGIYGDKNIYSTAEDMFRWDQSFYQHKLLNSTITDMAFTPYSFEKRGIKNYGLGWRMFCGPNGNKVIYHNGWWHGNNTSFYRLIKDNMTIVVLGNRFTNSIYHQAPKVYSIVKRVAVDSKFDTEY
jgi:CubicO group peptidase (beta-lactamase class C family)